jgi:Na+/proline symporter
MVMAYLDSIILPPITIDILIFIAFFALNIIVGFRHRGKSQSFREYAVGDKKFSTATLTATIVATVTSGSVLFLGLENTYGKGLYYALATLIGATAGILITGRVVGPRMGKFLNNVSLPEALGKLYGKYVQLIAGASCVVLSIGYIAVQFKVITKVLSIISDYENPGVVLIAAAIVTLYSLSGGVKAVTFTDVLQFFTFGTLLPILALAIWNNLQDHNQIIHMLRTNPLFSLKEVVGWSPEFLKTLVLMAYFAVPEFAPELFQRIAMARDTTQVKNSMTYAAIICLGLELCIIWISILLLTDQPGLAPNRVVPYMVNAHLYPGLKGFLGIGVIALAMSTADSTINSTAVIITNDVLPPLKLQKEGSLKAAKYATLFLGVFSVLLALRVQGLLDIILFSACFYSPIVIMPMLLAIFGFQTSRRVVYMAMGVGLVTVTTCLIAFESVNSFFPGMLANLIVMLGAHYLLGEKGGWGHNPIPVTLEQVSRNQAWQWRLQAVKNFQLYPYLKQHLPSQEGIYSLFGLYTLAATYSTFYTIEHADNQAYQAINTGIYHAVLPVATAFLTFSVWPATVKSKRFMTFFWPIGIAGIFFFAGTLLVIISHFHHVHVMIMMINLLMAVMLLQWPLVLFLAFTGTYAAITFFTHYTGATSPLSVLGSVQIVYLILLFTSLLIALKGRQVYQRLVTSQAQLKEENSFSSELRIAFLQQRAQMLQATNTYQLEVIALNDRLREQLAAGHHSQAHPPNIDAVLHQHAYKLDILNRHWRQVLGKTQDHIHLVVENVALKALLRDVFTTLYRSNKSIKVHTQQYTKCQFLQADVGKLKKLLLAGLSYAASQQKANRPVLLGIEDTQLAYPLMSMPGYIKQVEAVRITITTTTLLPMMKRMYLGSVDEPVWHLPHNVAELPMTYNQQIIDAHYGASELVMHYPGVTQIYVVPTDVREIRPETMDQWPAAIAEENTETTFYATESAFVKAVQDKTRIDQAMLQDALKLIKQHHKALEEKTGKPSYLHPIAVAQILLDYTRDPDTILAALLHDMVADTDFPLTQVALRFNPVVQRIVDGVTHVDSRLSSFKKIQLSPHEAMLKLLEVKDDRILYVKLADRLHNMRTIGGYASLITQKKIAEETLHFFVPVAKHLKLHAIEKELQEIATHVIKKTTI